MRHVALIGSPIDHSLSPAIHQAAFRALGLDWKYSLKETKVEGLADVIQQLRQPDWQGANVTIPLKTHVAGYLDGVSQEAKAIGAVNTIFKRGEQLLGDNTDAAGFLSDLRTSMPVEVKAINAVLLGSGGAARAVAHALGQEGVTIRLLARNQNKAERLMADLPSDLGPRVKWYPWEFQGFTDASAQAQLVINATPVGMEPLNDECPWPPSLPLPEGAYVYDLIYRPAPTRLVSKALAQGLSATNGLGMLIEQAALSFQRWTGLEAPKAEMVKAAQEAMEAVNA